MGLADRTPASRARKFPATKIHSNLSAKTSSPSVQSAIEVPLPIKSTVHSIRSNFRDHTQIHSTSSVSHNPQLEVQKISLHPLTERSNRKPPHLRPQRPTILSASPAKIFNPKRYSTSHLSRLSSQRLPIAALLPLRKVPSESSKVAQAERSAL